MPFAALAAFLLQASTPAASSVQPPAPAAASKWPIREADFTVANFRFRSGETLPSVRIHYTMLGQPHRGADGQIDNAVMVLHGTGGAGKQFLSAAVRRRAVRPRPAARHPLLHHPARQCRPWRLVQAATACA
jgi:hypothetical protein